MLNVPNSRGTGPLPDLSSLLKTDKCPESSLSPSPGQPQPGFSDGFRLGGNPPPVKTGILSPIPDNPFDDGPVSFGLLEDLLEDGPSHNGTLTNVSLNPGLLGITPRTGARVTLDSQGDAGDFLCSHVMRIGTELRSERPEMVAGFVHIPEYPRPEQLAEVVGMGIRGVVSSFADKPEVTMLLTGFTRFGNIEDNASGRFLFGDGRSDDLGSFGLRAPASRTIDAMIAEHLGTRAQASPLVKNGKTVGRSYRYADSSGQPRTLHLATARLPVDEDLNPYRSGANNPAGDGAGDILRRAARALVPDAILSLGVGIYGEDDRYEVEVNAPGLQDGIYHREQVSNNSLGEVYAKVITPSNIV